MLANQASFNTVLKEANPLEQQGISLSELNDANFNLMRQYMPHIADQRELLAKLIQQNYLKLGDSRFTSKTPEEQWQFSLMMADKTFTLNELYKTEEGKKFIDDLLKSSNIDISKKT